MNRNYRLCDLSNAGVGPVDGVRKFVVSDSGIRLSAEIAGPAHGPALVLLHGLTATRKYVVPGVSLGDGMLRVVAYDARGHGRSCAAPRPDAYDYDELERDLLAVLNACGVAQAVLVGVSMGAQTALRFAVRHPERVAGIMVITPAYDPDPERRAEMEAYGCRLSAALRADGVDGFLAACSTPTCIRPALARTLRTMVRRRLEEHRRLEAVADAIEHMSKSRPFATLSQLAVIRVPTTVVGSRDDVDLDHPLKVARAYASHLPEARWACEEPGATPLAWSGKQLAPLVMELATRAFSGAQLHGAG